MGVNDVIQAMRQQQLSQHHGQDDRESKERMVDKLGEQLRRLCEMKDTEYMVPFTTMCLLARRI
jgi:hypothetical protein